MINSSVKVVLTIILAGLVGLTHAYTSDETCARVLKEQPETLKILHRQGECLNFGNNKVQNQQPVQTNNKPLHSNTRECYAYCDTPAVRCYNEARSPDDNFRCGKIRRECHQTCDKLY